MMMAASSLLSTASHSSHCLLSASSLPLSFASCHLPPLLTPLTPLMPPVSCLPPLYCLLSLPLTAPSHSLPPLTPLAGYTQHTHHTHTHTHTQSQNVEMLSSSHAHLAATQHPNLRHRRLCLWFSRSCDLHTPTPAALDLSTSDTTLHLSTPDTTLDLRPSSLSLSSLSQRVII
jgi:hypothetical protein